MTARIKLLSTGLLILSGVKAISRQTITPSMELGPYSKYQENPIVFYTIKSTYTVDKSIYEIFRFGDANNPSIQTVTKSTHTVSANSSVSRAITIPTKLLLGDNGMSITIEIYNSDGTEIREKACFIYPINSETIDPTTYNGVYFCPQTHVVMTNSIVRYTEENYSFPKVNDYFLTDVYYRLPLEQFTLQTSLSYSEFTYSSAYLYVYGMEEYFPGLYYRNGKASIPLQVNYNNGLLTLSIKDNLYVEPKLLIMSTSTKIGYLTTRNFYLPVNHCKDLLGSSFNIVINSVGYNKTTFSWNTTLLAESPLIGDCQNSGYCVVGRVVK